MRLLLACNGQKMLRKGTSMICLVCKTPMQTRKGRHGEFYYCPNGNHGTIGVAKYRELMEHFTITHKPDMGYSGSDPLMTAIEIQTMALGGGILPDIERFYIDNEAYYDDPDDFWQNHRPY